MPANEDGNGNGGGGDALASLVKNNKELLASAALSAAGAVAAAKGPALVKRLTDATENKSEEQAQQLGSKVAEGAKSSLGGVGKLLGGGGSGAGGKKTRRLPIQRWTDVAVPVDKAYDAFTKFDDWPKFMHRVLNVEKKGQDKISYQEKIWFSKRQWEGRITERRKNDRIVWKTTSGMSHKGVVSFHPVGENLTRVMVDMEFEPNGMMEKMASGLRFVKRAAQADLARFKAYVEMEDAKGIEYRSTKEDEDEQQGREQQGRGRGGSDPQEAEEAREERRQRRDERRKAAT